MAIIWYVTLRSNVMAHIDECAKCYTDIGCRVSINNLRQPVPRDLVNWDKYVSLIHLWQVHADLWLPQINLQAANSFLVNIVLNTVRCIEIVWLGKCIDHLYSNWILLYWWWNWKLPNKLSLSLLGNILATLYSGQTIWSTSNDLFLPDRSCPFWRDFVCLRQWAILDAPFVAI